MAGIIDKIKKAPIVIATAAAFTAGVWTGNASKANDYHANPVEGAKIKEVVSNRGTDASIPRDLGDPMHIPLGDTAYVRVYYGNRFAREYSVYADSLLHDRYGLVQLVVDISLQSDALPVEAGDEIPE